jgi:hypothetical protein
VEVLSDEFGEVGGLKEKEKWKGLIPFIYLPQTLSDHMLRFGDRDRDRVPLGLADGPMHPRI